MLTIKAKIKRSELKVDGTYNVKIKFAEFNLQMQQNSD